MSHKYFVAGFQCFPLLIKGLLYYLVRHQFTYRHSVTNFLNSIETSTYRYSLTFFLPVETTKITLRINFYQPYQPSPNPNPSPNTQTGLRAHRHNLQPCQPSHQFQFPKASLLTHCSLSIYIIKPQLPLARLKQKNQHVHPFICPVCVQDWI